jgi:hypothetical protein
MKVTRKCANDRCNNEFVSEHHWNKRYCSHKCYQNAKVFRRVARDKTIPFNYDPDDMRFIVTLNFPTKERLDREAQMLGENEQVKVIGMNHHWEHPDNIQFVKQERMPNDNSEDVWVMFKSEPIPDLVKHILNQ